MVGAVLEPPPSWLTRASPAAQEQFFLSLMSHTPEPEGRPESLFDMGIAFPWPRASSPEEPMMCWTQLLREQGAQDQPPAAVASPTKSKLLKL